MGTKTSVIRGIFDGFKEGIGAIFGNSDVIGSDEEALPELIDDYKQENPTDKSAKYLDLLKVAEKEQVPTVKSKKYEEKNPWEVKNKESLEESVKNKGQKEKKVIQEQVMEREERP